MSDLDYQYFENLWEDFSNRKAQTPGFSLDDFVQLHPDIESDIMSLFPLMEQLTQSSFDNERVPETIGTFEIVRRVGVGGRGSVFEAIGNVVHDRFAIKAIDSTMVGEKAASRFEREAKILASFHHSNIVPVFNYGTDGDLRYYVMKMVEGASLAKVLHPDIKDDDDGQSAFANEFVSLLAENWSLQADLVSQAANALNHAHQSGVLHRDIKPGNLLVDVNQKLWVADFGEAKEMDARDWSIISKVYGTPRYMAPEQIRGLADERSDVFSLGLVLYEMMLLRKDESAVRRPIWEESLPLPSASNPDVPENLERIAMRAIQHVPSERFQSMQELLAELDRFTSCSQPFDYGQASKPVVDVSFRKFALEDGCGVDDDKRVSLPEKPSERFTRYLPWMVVPILLAAITWSFVRPSKTGLDQTRIANENDDVTEDSVSKMPAPDSNTKKPQLFDTEGQSESPNHPPTFSPKNFSRDNRIIEIAASRSNMPQQLRIDDDENNIFGGLIAKVIGGQDAEDVVMTPQGIFVLDSHTKVDKQKYEIEVSVQDRAFLQFARLEPGITKGNWKFCRDLLLPQSKIETVALTGDVMLPKGLIDIATFDGATFFHLHSDDSGTCALYSSEIDTKKNVNTNLISNNCGIPQAASGFCARRESEFLASIPSASTGKVTLIKYRLVGTNMIENDRLGTFKLGEGLSGLGWIDESRFSQTNRDPKGTRFLLGFQRRSGFTRIPVDKKYQFASESVGHAAWIEHLPGSAEMIRKVAFYVTPDSDED